MSRFYEPWTARKSTLWDIGLKVEPGREDPDEQLQARLEWREARRIAERDADWTVWGTGMSLQVPLRSMLGTESVSSGEEIITTVRKALSWPQDGPTHGEVAIRVVDCVNAMAGVLNPCRTLQEVKDILTDLARCETGFDDERILVVLARLGVSLEIDA